MEIMDAPRAFISLNVADEGLVGLAVSGADENDWEPRFDEAYGSMFAFACWKRDSWHVGDFHEFESAFVGGGGVYASAEEEEDFCVFVLLGEFLDFVFLCEDDGFNVCGSVSSFSARQSISSCETLPRLFASSSANCAITDSCEVKVFGCCYADFWT